MKMGMETEMKMEMEMKNNTDMLCNFQIYLSPSSDTVPLFFSGRLICDCGRRFKYQFSMMCHQRSECGEEYRCEKCTFKSNKLHLWLRHVKTPNCTQ